MNLKIAKMICNYQGIDMQIRVPAKCPNCNKETLTLFVEDNVAWCKECNGEWTMMELLRLCEEDELERHRRAFWDSRNNKGVEQ